MKSWGEQGRAGLLQVREEEEGLEETAQLCFVVVFCDLWQVLGGSCTADPWISTSCLRHRGQPYIFKILPLFLLFQLNNERIGVDITELRLYEKNFIFWFLPPIKTSPLLLLRWFQQQNLGLALGRAERDFPSLAPFFAYISCYTWIITSGLVAAPFPRETPTLCSAATKEIQSLDSTLG